MNPDFQEYFVTADLKYICNQVEQLVFLFCFVLL